MKEENGSILLELSHVSKNFGGLAAVDDVSMKIDEGEIVGLIGPNGAGKTTLFNLVTGFLPLDSGKIYFDKKDISNHYAYKISQLDIGRTFQLPKIFNKMTIVENVMVGALKKSNNTRQARRKAMEILDFVGLADRGNSFPTSLTVAHRKQLEVCRALATSPKLLLLDEIIAGLTPKETVDMMGLIRKLSERGITLFLIEHVMKFIMNISQRVVVLHHGQKIADAPPSQIANDERVIKAYLGKRTA